MNGQQYERVFSQFLDGYWGAFHELLEAESVRRDRLANSFFAPLLQQHERFAAVCPDDARPHVETLGRVWRQALDRRRIMPDAPLTSGQIQQALGEFTAIYDVLDAMGRRHRAARDRVIKQAAHATPREPLRADVTS